jgi:hypothetical protein
MNKLTARSITALVIPALLSVSTAAAQPVQWDQISKTIGESKKRSDGRGDRLFLVTTKDGQTHSGFAIALTPAALTLDASAPIPREDVKQIRIHLDSLFWDGVGAPAQVLDTGAALDSHFPSAAQLLVSPLQLALVAALMPITIPAQTIKRTLPDTVIEVAP